MSVSEGRSRAQKRRRCYPEEKLRRLNWIDLATAGAKAYWRVRLDGLAGVTVR
jgi:hypothetical protein